METVKFDHNKAFETLWVTNALEESENFLSSDEIMSLVGESMRKFRNKLMNKPPQKNCKFLNKFQ